MVVLGTKPEFFNAVWVKNEWSRYLAMMQDDKSKHLIPCFKYLDAYDIPKEFKNLQALNMEDVTFYKNLNENIKRAVNVKSIPVITNTENAKNVEPLLKRAFMFLEDGDWKSANEYCEKVLDIVPENAQAYLGKLMVELKVNSKDKLKDVATSFENKVNYQKIVKFGNESLIAELKGCIENINNRNKKTKKQQEEKKLIAKQKRKKRKKIAIVIPTSILSIALCVFLVIGIIIPKNKFKEITAISAIAKYAFTRISASSKRIFNTKLPPAEFCESSIAWAKMKLGPGSSMIGFTPFKNKKYYVV